MSSLFRPSRIYKKSDKETPKVHPSENLLEDGTLLSPLTTAQIKCHSAGSIWKTDSRVSHVFCVRRQSLIRPMGVKPDGTLAPLEETLRAPPGDDAGSDSD